MDIPPMNMTRAYVFNALKSEWIKVLLACVELSETDLRLMFLVSLVHCLLCADMLNVVSISMVEWVLESVRDVPSVIWGKMFPCGGYNKDPQNELRFIEPHMCVKRLTIC